MKRRSFYLTIILSITLLICISHLSFADGGDDEPYIYDSAGIAEELNGRVIMKTGGYQPVILEKGAYIDSYTTLETKENSSLFLRLGPEVARGNDYMSSIMMDSNTEIKLDFNLPASYYNTEIWWEDDSYWLDNEISYDFEVLNGRLLVSLNSNIFECIKELKLDFEGYSIIPVSSNSETIEIEIEIINDAKYEEDFVLTDIYSMKVIVDMMIREKGAESIDELSEDERFEIDNLMSSYEMTFMYQKCDLMVVTVNSGRVKIKYKDVHDVMELEAGQAARFGEFRQ